MNRHQEALRDFLRTTKVINGEKLIIKNEYSADKLKQYEQQTKTLQELVDKATPKKVLNIRSRKYRPFYDRYDEVVGKCPNEKCISYVFKEKDRSYCADCGQALDWSEYE